MKKIYLMDEGIKDSLIDTINEKLPDDWKFCDVPEEATALLTENVDIEENFINKFKEQIKVIFKLDTGKAQIKSDQIKIIRIPNTALVGVAEHTILLVMNLAKHFVSISESTNAQKWERGKDIPIYTDQNNYTYNWIGIEDFGLLHGKTIGLVGFGYIAQEVAKRLKPFGMKILYTKRTRLSEEEEQYYEIEWREFQELLAESDFISLHHRFMEGENGNDKHFGLNEFSLMKKSAFLINTARGRLIDEDALIEALKKGEIAGAGLDVLRYEPFMPESPIRELIGEKLIITPHIGGAPLDEAYDYIADKIIMTIKKL